MPAARHPIIMELAETSESELFAAWSSLKQKEEIAQNYENYVPSTKPSGYYHYIGLYSLLRSIAKERWKVKQ